MISEKHRKAAKKNIEKATLLGLNRHFGEKNPRWNGGNRLIGLHPCPICGIKLYREKRYSKLKCISCGRKYRKAQKLKENATRAAYYWRARQIIIKTGASLTSEDHVHHRNGDWKDNRIQNLLVVSKYEHRRRFHNSQSKDFVC